MIVLVAISYQSCDSKLNIDKPTTFIKYIGGHGNQTGIDMTTDAEGGIYILGSTTSVDSAQQLYIVKANQDGNVVWEQVYGGAGDETPKDIELMSDGNLAIVADVTDSGERDFQIYVLNASDGTLIMTGNGGTTGKPDYANSITQTTDGFIVASYIDEGVFKTGWVRRFHTDLVEFGGEWTSDINQFEGASGHDVIPVKVFQSGTVFYTFGYTNSTADGGGPDYNVLITATNDLNGLLRVFVPKGTSAASDERVTTVTKVPGGAGFVISGYSTTGSTQELFMLRVVGALEVPTTTPDIISVAPKNISSGLSSASSASFASTFPSASSGFYVLGEKNSTGNSDLYLTRVDNIINPVWTAPDARVFGGAGNDVAGALAEANDGSVLICGTMVLGDALGQQKIVLMKLNTQGMLGN